MVSPAVANPCGGRKTPFLACAGQIPVTQELGTAPLAVGQHKDAVFFRIASDLDTCTAVVQHH